MNIKEMQDVIVEKLLNKSNKLNSNRIKYSYLTENLPEFYNNLLNTTSFLDNLNPTIAQRLYHVYYNISHQLKCPECGSNQLTFIRFNKGYKTYCCVKCASGAKSTIDKRSSTCKQKYNCDWPMQSEEIWNKSINTVKKKYNVTHISKSEYFRNQVNKTSIQTHKEKIKKLERLIINNNLTILEDSLNLTIDKMGLVKLQCNNGHIFERIVNSLWYNLSCPKCKSNHSDAEKELENFIRENGIDEIKPGYRIYYDPSNKRKFIELDVFLPEYNIAIEYDGIYWHSEQQGKDKNYHLFKTDLCKKFNIQLVHIFEDEWKFNKDMVKSIILSKLGIYSNKYYARNCVVKEIDSKTKNDFLEDNHLQGKDKSSVKLGLFNGNKLLSVMTFGRRKITGGKPQYELIRYCNQLNTLVIGGASKLFKYFINSYSYNEITTYSDRRYSDGTFYEKLGFELDHLSSPNYFYLNRVDRSERRENRIRYQKHKLRDKLEYFNPDLTEWENMQINGFDRIWDCGNYVYKYK